MQQKENRSPRRAENNRNKGEPRDPKGNQGGDDSRTTEHSNEASNDLLRSMRKKMDKLRNAMKGKTVKNLDGMVRRTDSPFTQKSPRMLPPTKISTAAARII